MILFYNAKAAGGSPASLRPGRWLDLYSGTGSVGIEALSRGCSEVLMFSMSGVQSLSYGYHLSCSLSSLLSDTISLLLKNEINKFSSSFKEICTKKFQQFVFEYGLIYIRLCKNCLHCQSILIFRSL